MPVTKEYLVRCWKGLLPLEQNELRAKGRTHRGEDAVGARFAGRVEENIFEDGKNRGGGEVADLAKTTPGGFEGVGRQVECCLHGLENLRATGVKDVAGNIVERETVITRSRTQTTSVVVETNGTMISSTTGSFCRREAARTPASSAAICISRISG